MKIRLITHITALTIYLCSLNAKADLSIEITQGVEATFPIAIVPFTKEEEVDYQYIYEPFSTIIQNDLNRSGLFRSITGYDKVNHEDPDSSVDYDKWRKLGMDALVIGEFSPIDEQFYNIRYRLINILKAPPTGKKRHKLSGGKLKVRKDHLLEHKVWRSHKTTLRALAHHISDRIHEQLTGEKGAFATEIVYVSIMNPNDLKKKFYKLQLADSDGYNPRTLFSSREPILSPSWSPDGKMLAYVSFEKGRPEIYIQNIAEGTRRRVTSFSGLNGAPNWSPDGKRLALVLSKDGNPEIYVVDIASRKLIRVTNNAAIDTEPMWMPDGKSILFTSSRSGGAQIYRKYFNKKWPERVTFKGNQNFQARVTSDGAFIVYVHQLGKDFHIAKQHLESGQVDILMAARLGESPTIAPNDQMVMYATLEGNKTILSVVSMDGRIKMRLPSTTGEVREPAWSPYLKLK